MRPAPDVQPRSGPSYRPYSKVRTWNKARASPYPRYRGGTRRSLRLQEAERSLNLDERAQTAVVEPESAVPMEEARSSCKRPYQTDDLQPDLSDSEAKRVRLALIERGYCIIEAPDNPVEAEDDAREGPSESEVPGPWTRFLRRLGIN